MKGLVIIIVLAILAIAGYYYFNKSAYAPTPPTLAPESSAPSSPAPTASPAATNEREIKVNLSSFKFTPSVITIKAGEKVKLTLSSSGPHTFTVDKLAINYAVGSGETKSFELMVAQKGTYQVYCATPGHKEQGMVAKLVVE